MFNNEIKFDNIGDCMAYLFGFDSFLIKVQPNCEFNIEAIISKGDTVINFYKQFVSLLDEIDRCGKDFNALIFFKNLLKELKDNFDKIMEEKKGEIEKVFKKHRAIITISYLGEFGEIYNRVQSLVG